MDILFDYEGASIDVLENDIKNNIITVSPKIENDAYSNYYNFKVKNDSNEEGIVYIKNLNNLLFDSDIMPFYRKDKEVFKHIDKDKIKKESDGIKISIDKKEEIEISQFPRYTKEDLDIFFKNIKNENVKISDDIVKKITIGDENKKAIVVIGRQHPGETLSSFFIEGMISEIVENYQEYKDSYFLFYPIVSTNGVKNGNHRYTDGIDYNRSWKTSGLSKEIDYIKEELSKIKIDNFIDVHCDEISDIDYVRTKKSELIKEFSNVKVIADNTKLRRFFRALIRQRKIINLSQLTAREYVAKKYKCDSMLIELGLQHNDSESSREKGKEFIKNLKRG